MRARDPPSGDRSHATAAAMSAWTMPARLRHVLHVREVVVALAGAARFDRTSRSRRRRSRARPGAARAPRRSGRDPARRAARRCQRTRVRQASPRRRRSASRRPSRGRDPDARPLRRRSRGWAAASRVRSTRAESTHTRDGSADGCRLPRVASPGWAICRSRRSRTCSAHAGASRPICGRRRSTRYAALSELVGADVRVKHENHLPSARSRCAAASTSWPSSPATSAPAA